MLFDNEVILKRGSEDEFNVSVYIINSRYSLYSVIIVIIATIL